MAMKKKRSTKKTAQASKLKACAKQGKGKSRNAFIAFMKKCLKKK